MFDERGSMRFGRLNHVDNFFGTASGCQLFITKHTFEVAPVDAGAFFDDGDVGANGRLAAAALTSFPPRPIGQVVGVQV